jgi:hypothetical protein
VEGLKIEKVHNFRWHVDWPSGVSAKCYYVNRRTLKSTVAWTLNGDAVFRCPFKLDSMDDRAKVVRELKKKKPEDDWLINWNDHVQDLSNIVSDGVKQGEPAVLVGNIPLDESVEWAIQPILINNEHNVLWADGGSGKSFFALYMATLIQEGYNYSDSTNGLSVEPANVLYLDYETKNESIGRRVAKIHKGMGIEHESAIRVRHCDRPIDEDIDNIMEMCAVGNIGVVIVDSMAMAISGDGLESSSSVINYFNALSLLNLTTLTISHSNKQGGLFGSQYTRNYSRSVFECQKTGGKFGKGMDFSLIHTKANDVAQQPPMQWEVSFEDDAVTYTRTEYSDDDDDEGEISYAKIIQDTLKKNDPIPVSKQEIVDVAYVAKAHSPAMQNMQVEERKKKVAEQVASNLSKAIKPERGEPTVIRLEDGTYTLGHSNV